MITPWPPNSALVMESRNWVAWFDSDVQSVTSDHRLDQVPMGKILGHFVKFIAEGDSRYNGESQIPR